MKAIGKTGTVAIMVAGAALLFGGTCAATYAKLDHLDEAAELQWGRVVDISRLRRPEQRTQVDQWISIERLRFNEAARTFNAARSKFPTSAVAGLFPSRLAVKSYVDE